ncbi:MAG: replication initiator protein A, partial [Fusobacteriaceae bacterium]|nr:replication initiator protein A [Fusobacteriaceae bacterium]
MSEEAIEVMDLKNENQEIVDSLIISNSGSLLEDITNLENINDFEITSSQVPDIELKEIVVKGTGNFLNLQENVVNIPIEMIVFPFFTYQKQNKRKNFEYDFRDLGVKMFSILTAKSASDKVFQPSTFEEKIYTYLISMYECKKEKNDNEDYIEFEISDFITNFLGNKMNRTYYIKVEQALKNLKSTEYQFIISNHTNLGKYKFEDAEFKLLTYQKLSKGKKKYYRVILNKNVRQKIKSKRYIIYNSKALLEILTKDPIAGRIYRYISKIRYDKGIGSINVRTLAAIIPLKTEQITTRKDKKGKDKEYTLCRLKQVVKRIEKAFDCLVELGYILEGYLVEESKAEDTYYIKYRFNPEKDGKCHISEYIIKNKKREKEEIEDAQIITERNLTVLNGASQKLKTTYMVDKENQTIFPESLLESIKLVKKNIYVKKAWNIGIENRLLKILDEYGINTVKEVLNRLYRRKTPIRALVQFVNGI